LRPPSLAPFAGNNAALKIAVQRVAVGHAKRPARARPVIRALALAAIVAALLPASLLGPRAQTPGAAGPADLVASAKLVYRTTAQFRLAGLPVKMSARTTTTWLRQGERYEAHLHMDTVDFDQLSQGRLEADGALAPTSYTEKRPFHAPESVRIDWPGRQMQFGASPPVTAPPSGAQDRLSLQFELARLRLRQPERFATGSTHDVRLIGTHDVDPWTFTVGAEENIDAGPGSMRAVRYSARRVVGTAQETIDIWLGADLRWMPVRIRMVDRNQSIIDSVLQSSEMP
jgi:hypothetical protein